MLQCFAAINFFHSSNTALNIDVEIDVKMSVTFSCKFSAVSNELPSHITFRCPKSQKSVGAKTGMSIGWDNTYCESQNFKVDPGFIPRDDTSEIVNLKFVNMSEKFRRNLDPFQCLIGGEGVRNPFELYPAQG
jgi:hypothetical protein